MFEGARTTISSEPSGMENGAPVNQALLVSLDILCFGFVWWGSSYLKKVMKLLFVIPARLNSTRLPGKMLLKLRGEKSILQCTFERVLQSSFLSSSSVIVATDSPEIFSEVTKFGGQAMMTSSHCASGSDRVGEVLHSLKHPVDLVVNIQGDEPFLDPTHLDAAVRGLMSNPWADASTVAVRVCGREEEFKQTSKVKVVVDGRGSALYFSRMAIPFQAKTWLRHVGLYAFRPPVLTQLISTNPAPLEKLENLEQLRLLESGLKMHVSIVDSDAFGGIDTPSDYYEACARVRQGSF